MQRSACVFGLAALLLMSGCATPSPNTAARVPKPLMDTRSRPPAWRPAPSVSIPLPDRQPTIARKPPPPRDDAPAPWSEAELIPPGGIRPGMWKVFVVHHSASDKDTPQGMDNYHRNVQGWINGLGYDFVIGNGVNYPDGKVYVGPRWKRQISGAHCKAGSGVYFGIFRANNWFNDHGIGICLVGNFEQSQPTRRQIASLERLIAYLAPRTGANPRAVYGHGQVTGKTACPGRYLTAQLASVRSAVSRVSLVDDPSRRAIWEIAESTGAAMQPFFAVSLPGDEIASVGAALGTDDDRPLAVDLQAYLPAAALDGLPELVQAADAQALDFDHNVAAVQAEVRGSACEHVENDDAVYVPLDLKALGGF